MKLFLSCISLLLLIVSPVLAQFSLVEDVLSFDTSDTSYYDTRDPCEYTDRHLTFIETASDIFHEQAEEKIVQPGFGDTSYEELARGLTDELVMTFETILDICRDGQTEFYDWSQPMHIRDLASYVASYKQVLDGLRTFVRKNPEKNDMVTKAMLHLQNHLLGDGFDQFIQNVFVEKKSEFQIELAFENQEGALDMDLEVTSLGVGDTRGTQADGNVLVNTNIDVDDREEELKFVGGATLDVRIVDNHIYVRVNESDVNINESSLTEEQRKDRDKFQETLQLVEGKWIDIFGGIGLPTSSLMWTEMTFSTYKEMMKLAEQPWLITYTEDAGVSYAGINPMLCLAGNFMDGIQGCLEYVWLASREATGGKGFVKITQQSGRYVLELTDTYTDEPFPEEMKHLRNLHLMSRDANELIYAILPFGEYGEIVYDAGDLAGTLSLGNHGDELIIDVTGTMDRQSFEVYTTLTSESVDGSLEMKKSGLWDDIVVDMDLQVDDTSDDGFSLGLHMFIDAEQEKISPRLIVAPDEDDVVDFSVFNS